MYILSRNKNLLSFQTSILTDGQFICFYKDIENFFIIIKDFLARKGVKVSDCLALECENSVPTALVLLYLLEEGYSFLLLPKEAKTSAAIESRQPIPKFCRYRISAESFTEDGKAVSLEKPEQYLQVAENEEWNGKTQQENSANKKLYMRTSGSTGTPKIAVHSHDKLLKNALNCVQKLGLTNDDKVAIPVPIYHMYGLGAGFLPSVLAGASIDLQKGANLLRYLQREKEFNPNVAFMTPIFCETLVKGRKSPREYRFTVAAGDRIREETFTKYESQFGCLVKLYGSTEMGAIAAASPDDAMEVRAKTVGLPMSGVQMRLEKSQVETTDDMKDFGELWCHYECGFEGYVDAEGNPINQSQDIQNNWFRTKDFGRIWSDGRVEVLGRCDRSVNRDGLLVLFSDVEKAIESIKGIESAVVVSKGESQRGKGLVAYCVLAKDANISETDIRAFCFDKLPKRAIPDRINLVNSLPLLPNGKVDLQKLIAMADNVESTNLVRS